MNITLYMLYNRYIMLYMLYNRYIMLYMLYNRYITYITVICPSLTVYYKK